MACSAAEGGPLGRLSALAAATLLAVFVCSATIAGVSGKMQKQIVMFHQYPVRVDVDLEARTAIVSPPDNIPGIGKSRTFYDYNTRVIAYKDYRARQCHLERMSPDEKLPGTEEEEEVSGGQEQREEGERAAEREAERRLQRQMGLLGPPTPRNRQRRAADDGQSKGNTPMQRNRPKTMYVTETVLSKYKVLRLAGRRISHFCRGFPATLLVQRPPSPPPPQLRPPSRVPWLSENELPGDGDTSNDEEHRLLLEAALVKARLAELEMQTLDNSGEEKPRSRTSKTTKGSRSKRQATGNGGNRGWYWPKKFRGQTQSQFVSFSGDGKNDGTAQAESRPEGTTTLVRAANGMGQSQSQSSVGDDCDGCFPGGYGGGGYQGGGGPWQQPGYGASGALGGRTPGAILGQPGAGGVNGIGGSRGPGVNGGRIYTSDGAGYVRPGAVTPGAQGYDISGGIPGGQNGQVRPGSMVHRPGGVAGGSGGYPDGEIPGRGVISGRPGYGSRGDGSIVGPTGGAPGGAVPGRGVISGRPGYGANGDGVHGIGVGGPGYTPSREGDQSYRRPGATNGHQGTYGVGGPGYDGSTVGGPGYGVSPGELSRTPGYRPGADIHGHGIMPGGPGLRRPQNGVHPGGRPGHETVPHAQGPGYGRDIHGVGGLPHQPGGVTSTIPSGHHTTGHGVHGGGAQPSSHIGYPSSPGHQITNGHRVVPVRHDGHVPGHYIPTRGQDSQHLQPGMIQRPHSGAGTHDFSSPGYDSTHPGRDGRHEGGLISPSGAYPGSHVPSGHGGPVGPQDTRLYPSGHGVAGHGLYGPGEVGRRPSGVPSGGHVSTDGYRGYPSGSGVSQGSGMTPGEGAIGHHARGHGAGPGVIGTGPGGTVIGPGGIVAHPGGAGIGHGGIGVGPGGIGAGPGGIGAGPGGIGVGPVGRGMGPTGRGFGPSGGGVGPSGGGIAPGEIGLEPGARGITPSGVGGPGGIGVRPGIGGHRPGVGPSVGVDRPTGHGVGVGPGAGVDATGRHYYPSGSGVYQPGRGETISHGYPGHRPGPHDGRHPSQTGGYDRYPPGSTGHGLHHVPGSDGLYQGQGAYPPGGAIPGHMVPESMIGRGHGGPGFDGRYPDRSGVLGPGGIGAGPGGIGVGPGGIGAGPGGIGVGPGGIGGGPGGIGGGPGGIGTGTVGAQRPGGGLDSSLPGRPGERQTYPGGPGYIGGQRTPGAAPGYGSSDGQVQYGRPGYYNGQQGAYPLTRPGQGGRTPGGAAIGGESQAQSSVVQDDKEIKAGASSQGKLGDGKAQAQVSGSYSGSGSFSAQAQTSDGGRGAQSQVTGNKDGGSSSAQGNGGAGQSQAQVQLSSGNGATKAEAQSGGWQHGSNTQVQAGENGGMADAQSSGPGTTSSQAQVGFKPHRGNGNGQRTPFRGGGTASAQSGTYSGQSQSQVQGSYRYGVAFQGAAQAGTGSRGSRGINGEGRNGTRFERDDHAALIPDSVKLPPLKRFGDNNMPENTQLSSDVRQNGKNGQPLIPTSTMPPSSHHIHHTPDSLSSIHGSMQLSPSNKNGNQMMNGHSRFSEDSHITHGSHSQSSNKHHNGQNSFSSHRQYNGHTTHGSTINGVSNNNGMGHRTDVNKPQIQNGNKDQINHQTGEAGSGHRQHESKFPANGDGPKPVPIPQSSERRGDIPDEGEERPIQVFKTEAPRQSQSVFVSPMANEDVHITQASDGGGIPAQAVFQPGDLVPGTAGFRIPEGFRGRVIGDSRSIAGDETLAIASPNNGNSQSQTVVVTPGSGKVNYTRIVRPPNGKPVFPAYEDYGDNQEDSEDDYDLPTQISGHRVQTHRSSDSYSRGDQPAYSWSKPSTRNGETKPPNLYKDDDDFEDDDDEEEDDIEDDETEEEIQPSTPPPPIPNSYVSVTKSVSGQLNPINMPQGKYDRQFPNGSSGLSGSNGGKFAHTYYTKSSTCGYFTFSCNVVFGSNGRAKICKPRPPTNPDGSPCCC